MEDPNTSIPMVVAPDRGCVFAAAAFDRLGVVAMEGCQQGHPGWQPPDGYVYLKQFSSAGAFIRRVRIGIGLDDAELAGIPHSASVLADGGLHADSYNGTALAPANRQHLQRDGHRGNDRTTDSPGPAG
jgi:hypothetical protein